jgi:eukaryotic-like serine/threonine-protein kinase
VVGTARYAAPEQAEEGRVDGRTDLYALAVVLVEACTGTVPVTGDTAFGTVALRAARGIDPPFELGPLRPVLARAGRPNPDERYKDAATMGSALASAARELPAPAPLALAGLGNGLEDVEPTRTGRPRPTRSGDPFTDETESNEPHLEIVRESRHAVMRRSAVPVVVTIAVMLALIAGGTLFLSTGGASVAAPSLVGLKEGSGARDATEAGVLMKVVERRISSDPAGLIIEQRPGPGAFLREGEEVHVVVSRGPPPVAIPNVAGKPLAEASALLQQAGFVVKTELVYDENVAKGIALGTDPPFGKKETPEQEVKLIVSNGPKPVPVPDVAGKSYDEAVQILAGKRLAAARQDAFSDTVPAGTVIGTEPAAGKEVPRDSTVTIIVSKGPEPVQVPNLVGKTVEVASQTLRDLGLQPDVENYSPGGIVRAQDPAGGSVVNRGSKVTLFL